MQRTAKRLVTLGLVASIAFGTVLTSPATALAATDAELAAEIERCSLEFQEAQAKVDNLMVQISDNESRLADVEATLPGQRDKTANSIRSLYKFQQSGGGLLDLVLSADDFSQFLSMVQYLDIIQNHNLEEIDRLIQLEDELSILNATLDAQRMEAEGERDRAAQALAEAEAAREQARQAALARAFSEAQAREAALEEARAHEGETFNLNGQDITIHVDPNVGTDNGVTETTDPGTVIDDPSITVDDGQDTQTDQGQEDVYVEEQTPESEPEPEPEPEAPSLDSREQFIQTWAERIDAFNAGYPLGGYGRTFAEAAYDYGVDPRWSPAIARMESSSGLYCFEEHNAWGWGDAAWGDWDTAIRSHVSGLASGYGYTLTWDAAQTYCPPNASYWYSMVSSCMYEIWGSDSL